MATYEIHWSSTSEYIDIPTLTPASNQWELQIGFADSNQYPRLFGGTYTSQQWKDCINIDNVYPQMCKIFVRIGTVSRSILLGAGNDPGMYHDYRLVSDGTKIDCYVDGTYTGSSVDTDVLFPIGALGSVARYAGTGDPSRVLRYFRYIDPLNSANNRSYEMDEGSGTTIVDSLNPGVNDGTLVNFPGDNSQWVLSGAGSSEVSQTLLSNWQLFAELIAGKQFDWGLVSELAANKNIDWNLLNEAYKTGKISWHALQQMVTDLTVGNQSYTGDLLGVYAGLPRPTVAHVFIESGQSNCQGRGLVGDEPAGTNPGPITGVKTWRRNLTGTMYTGSGQWYDLSYSTNQYENRGEFGSVLQLGLLLSQNLYDSKNHIYIIKADGNGKPIAGWLNNGAEAVAMYDGHITPALADLAATYDEVRLHCMFWDQGESDCGSATSAVYQSNLTQFVADVRAATVPNLPFIVRQLDSTIAQNASYLATVIAAQQAVAAADSNVHVISGPYTYNADNLHLNGTSQNTIGTQRYNLFTSDSLINSGIIYG